MSDWAEAEAATAKAISDAMKLIAERRWAKATPAERAKQGKLMRAGRRKKGKKR